MVVTDDQQYPFGYTAYNSRSVGLIEVLDGQRYPFVYTGAFQTRGDGLFIRAQASARARFEFIGWKEWTFFSESVLEVRKHPGGLEPGCIGHCRLGSVE